MKQEIGQPNESWASKEVIMLEVKFKQDVNWVIEERADHGNAASTATGEELSEGKLTHTDEE